MASTVVLFPGQGCQYAGMGADLLEAFPELESLYETGSQVLGFDLKKICLAGTPEELSQTRYAQPAIYVTELLCLEAAKRKGLTFAGAAGHSLGEYAAMTACGLLTPETGFRALQIRGQAMDLAAQESETGMYAIVKLPAEQIEQICADTEGFVKPVNYNSPLQTVIAGDIPALETAAAACKTAGGKAVKLAVAAAFHTQRMQSAADTVRREFAALAFGTQTARLYSNLTGGVLPEDTNMADYCADHCVNPVRFTAQLQAMAADGVTRFVELGPKKVLTKLVQQTLPEAEALFAGDQKGLAALETLL